MIPVPQSVLEALAKSFGTQSDHLAFFGGGQESSDGIVYQYTDKDTKSLLKILPIPVDNQRIGLLCLEERLKFVCFLGENGAQIVFPQISPLGNLYETCTSENYVWVGNLVVFLVAMLALAVMLLSQVAWYWWLLPVGIMFATFLLGLEFVTRIPNVHLAEFRDAMQHAEILLMVDVPVRGLTSAENPVKYGFVQQPVKMRPPFLHITTPWGWILSS